MINDKILQDEFELYEIVNEIDFYNQTYEEIRKLIFTEEMENQNYSEAEKKE